VWVLGVVGRPIGCFPFSRAVSRGCPAIPSAVAGWFVNGRWDS